MSRKWIPLKRRGIRIQALNLFIVVTTVLMALLFVFTNYTLQKTYDRLEEAQTLYAQCEKYAQTLQDSTDTLTQQVQYFSQTGEKMYMMLYFKEALSDKSELAIEELQATEREKAILSQAEDEADKLKQMQYHIIRLVATANSVHGIETTEEYQEYSLPDDEKLIAPSRKTEIARKLAFSSEYLQYWGDVSNHIKSFSNKVLERRQQEVENYSNLVSRYIMSQHILILALVVVILGVVLMYYIHVVVVMRKYSHWIGENQLLHPKGVRELRYLADAYNRNAIKKMEQEKQLRIRADYDALTGVINRGAFERLVEIKLADRRTCCGAFLLIDVDEFKSVNDGYGHDSGDAVLCCVATALKEKFREHDVVGRLGGDEFALWIEQVSKQNAAYIMDRIHEINKELQNSKKGIPKVSISVGISFAENGDEFKDIYKKSDTALYRVKENGRCGAAFFEA
jgi:diguanylate cyclase (GGDEF)-like protein